MSNKNGLKGIGNKHLGFRKQRFESGPTMSLWALLGMAVLAFATFTIIATVVYEMGQAFFALLFNGSVIHSTFSWFYGEMTFTGTFPQSELFLVYSSGMITTLGLMILLLLYPEPLYTNVVATVLGFRLLIVGFPLNPGSDGYHMAQISALGAYIFYAVVFLVWVLAIVYTLGIKVSRGKGRKTVGI